MELIKWTDDYSLGISEVDNQHKGLVILINELFSLMTKGKSKDHLVEIFDHLTDYTQKHFMVEEMMMEKYNYPDLEQHKSEHQKFIDQLHVFKSDFKTEKVTLSLEVLNFLKDWLLNHISITDKKYTPHIEKMMTE